MLVVASATVAVLLALAATAPAAAVSSVPGEGTVPIKAVRPVVGEGTVPVATGAQRRAFGFAVGEVRTYVLEPLSTLRPGESASWTIRLDAVEGDGDGWVASFGLEHERSDRLMGNISNMPRTESVRIEGRLDVNAYGFPLAVRFNERQVVTGEQRYVGGERRISYTFREGRFIKELKLGDELYEFDIAPVRHGSLDRDRPSGLYLMMAAAWPCRGGGDRCAAEPAFANPGLLSIALPALLEEEDGDRDFVFFKPIGFGGNPLGLISVASWVRAERDARRNYRRYFDVLRVRLGESAYIDLGDRTDVHAWKVEIEGSMRTAYVSPDGVVLRVDLPPHSRNHGDRWLRLRLPDEH